MEKRPSILSVNVFFLLTGIALIFIGGFFQSQNIYTGLLITEYILVLFPSIVFLKIKKIPIRRSLRLNKISLRQLVSVMLISTFAYPIAVIIQAIFLSILSNFTPLLESGVPIPLDMKSYLLSIFVFAIGPGICEEVMFRGVLIRAYEGLGIKKAIIISSFLFGIFHFNIFNLVGPIFLGIIFGLTLYKTNSILAPIVGHIINNFIAVTLGYLLINNFSNIGESQIPSSPIIDIMGIILLLLFLILCIYMVVTLLKKLGDIEEIEDLDVGKNTGGSFLVDYLPVIIVIIIFIYLNYKLLSIL